MRLLKRPQIFAVAFSTVLAVIVGVFAYSSSAATGSLYVFGPTSAVCESTGRTAAAGYQDSSFGLELQGFWDEEPVFLSFTFPDGRVFSPVVTGSASANTPYGLDGVIDMPANFPWAFTTTPGGDYYYTFQTSNKWQYGCYTFSAHGAASNRDASGSFVLVPKIGGQPFAGPTTLNVVDNTTGDPSGLHGALVNINGRGFLANEVISVWITAPDGTVIDYPQQQASEVGSFVSTFRFDEHFKVGDYSFTALGTRSDYQVISKFRLDSRPSQPSGWAQLRVAYPYPATVNQRFGLEVQGKRFDPSERVDLWLTLPDGSVRGLDSQWANEYGETYVIINLDERLPIGNYAITARGANSDRLVIQRFDVFGDDPNITNFAPDPNPVPDTITQTEPVVPADNPAQPYGPVSLDPQPEPFVDQPVLPDF